MMFAIRILSGIISSATIPTAMAYIADTTSGEERSKGMGILGAAMGLGMIVGPALGGWLGHNSFSVPFFVAGGLAVLNLPFAIFFLPESLQIGRQQGDSFLAADKKSLHLQNIILVLGQPKQK